MVIRIRPSKKQSRAGTAQVQNTKECAWLRPARHGVRTGTDLVAAMQQAGKIGLKLKPLRVYPPIRPSMSFADDDR